MILSSASLNATVIFARRLITTTAFLLAVRLYALVIAILGMLGGFLTPILISTGQDNPLGLFGYIAILDAGLGKNAPPVFTALGTVLTFLLLNIEIADFFSEAGSTLTFQFSGSFARDMTYSIAWAMFALVLLIAGIVKTTPASRYAAVGLLSVTMLKLFFHDLASLGQLYRIGALIGVAIIAMLASFVYQRFFITLAKNKQPKHEPTQ